MSHNARDLVPVNREDGCCFLVVAELDSSQQVQGNVHFPVGCMDRHRGANGNSDDVRTVDEIKIQAKRRLWALSEGDRGQAQQGDGNEGQAMGFHDM